MKHNRVRQVFSALGQITSSLNSGNSPASSLATMAVDCQRWFASSGAPVVTENRILTLDKMNPRVIKMEYAVRGPLVIRALAIEKELAQGVKKPFKNVIKANLGDAQAMGQKPVTFIRQVLACVCKPDLQSTSNYPPDVIERAKLLLNACAGRTVGAYSQSNGIEIIRKHVAEYIMRRDNQIPSDPEKIVLSPGASEAIRVWISLIYQTILTTILKYSSSTNGNSLLRLLPVISRSPTRYITCHSTGGIYKN
ncbi:unnamed protein product [Gongylonema pulchrum]|uniref:alanine transaminase n=1 Tax=Gongylonema pulchrum TaxID=637853 RepID=A0A183D5D3_9BILA|nr:unnamed protein product [Gongylonema pulchrum]